MINAEDNIRLAVLSQRLIAATYREIRKPDVIHKSSEGAVSISMHLPNAFEQSSGIVWVVEAYSYLFCPDGRSDSWTGKSPSEAISKAEDAVSSWVFMSEMDEFESDAFGERPES